MRQTIFFSFNDYKLLWIFYQLIYCNQKYLSHVFFLYSIQIQIDLNPKVHWGTTTQTVNEKMDIKTFFYVL